MIKFLKICAAQHYLSFYIVRSWVPQIQNHQNSYVFNTRASEKKGGGKKLAEELVLPYLGSIPLDGEIVANSDSGEPVVLSRPDSVAAKAFMQLADNCHKFLNPE